MVIAPNHIKNYVKAILSKNKYFDLDLGAFSFSYELSCTCGCIDFKIYKTKEPMVTAQCTNCKKEIIVYDLEQYPAATTYRPLDDILVQVEDNGRNVFSVGIIFEYSDEFDFDDKEFDENDLSWCQIYLHDKLQSKSFCIVDDETA